jgi:sRNA-binding regulator protein Hfq
VQALLNTPVILHLRGGTQLQGVLTAILTYEFVIQTRDGGFAFVMKHSVDVLEPAGKE